MPFNGRMRANHRKSEPRKESLLAHTCALAATALMGFGWCGCSTQAALRCSSEAVAAYSPAPEVVPTFEAIRLAKRYVADHPGTDFMVGSGCSMLPLYRDHTVVVIQRAGVSDLKTGMTAVFIGDQGRPVAHVLVKDSPQGWMAMGVANDRPDSTRVTSANLLGVVVRAYEPSVAPLAALARESMASDRLASMP